jgi:hypothetical protein
MRRAKAAVSEAGAAPPAVAFARGMHVALTIAVIVDLSGESAGRGCLWHARTDVFGRHRRRP